MFVNKFWNFVWLVEVIEKYLATSGSPKVFVNCRKNIPKFLGLYRAYKYSRKITSNFRNSEALGAF